MIIRAYQAWEGVSLCLRGTGRQRKMTDARDDDKAAPVSFVDHFLGKRLSGNTRPLLFEKRGQTLPHFNLSQLSGLAGATSGEGSSSSEASDNCYHANTNIHGHVENSRKLS